MIIGVFANDSADFLARSITHVSPHNSNVPMKQINASFLESLDSKHSEVKASGTLI